MTTVEQCHICGGEARLIREATKIQIGRRALTVEAERMRCSSCGAEFYLPGQMEAEQQAAVSQFRQQHRLLNAQQILGIRKKLGLTQADMEKLLGVGEKTVVRWERGTVFQGSSTDKLLRVIDNVHGAAEFLAQAHGVTLQRVDRPALSTPITPSASLGMRLHQEGPSVPLSDRQVLHMEDYRRRKADMKPVPRDMLQEAQL